MNSRMKPGRALPILTMVLGLATGSLYAAQMAQPGAALDEYFKHVQATLKQLDDKTVSSSDKLKIRTDLINGVDYWQQVRGKPGRAMGLLSFFQRKTPNAWHFTQSAMTVGAATIKIDFHVESFSGHPWLTEFDLVQVDERWLLAAFRNLTVRPVAPGADIKTVLEHYFKATGDAVERMYSGQMTKEEKQIVTMEYGFGAGYWVGQTKNKDLPAGTLFSWFVSKRPKSWEIEPARVAGDYAEAVVHFTSKSRHGDEQVKTYTFELSRSNGEWFLASHRSQKDGPDESTQVVIADAVPGGETPADITRQQLDILGQADVAMENLFKASEPLWIDARKARRGLGRLVAMTMGMSGKGEQKPAWEIITTTTDGDQSTITVKAIWPDSAVVKPFSRLSFSLQNTEQGWRLSDAHLLLN